MIHLLTTSVNKRIYQIICMKCRNMVVGAVMLISTLSLPRSFAHSNILCNIKCQIIGRADLSKHGYESVLSNSIMHFPWWSCSYS